MRYLFTIFLVVGLHQHSWCQEYFYEAFMSKRKLAYRYYHEKNYAEATQYLMPLYLRKKLKNKDVSMLADCLYKANYKEKALEIYQFMENGNIAFDQESRNQYYISMINAGQFNKAYRWYHQKDTLIDNSLFAEPIIENVEPVSINSEQKDFGPTPYQLGILFLSTRPTYSFIASKNPQGDDYPQTYYSILAEDGSLIDQQKIRLPFGPKASYAGLTVFDQGNKMIISANLYSTGNNTFFSLYYCEMNQQGDWEMKQQLELGSGNFLHPFYHEKEDKLYFAADLHRESGTDLYYCHLKNGLKQPALYHLDAAINTPGNELYPYIYQDSLLIFSSNGHFGLGGIDLYQVDLKKSKVEVKNLGTPINSPYNDYGLIFYPYSRFGFFSSNRDNSEGDDIYKFYLK